MCVPTSNILDVEVIRRMQLRGHALRGHTISNTKIMLGYAQGRVFRERVVVDLWDRHLLGCLDIFHGVVRQ